LKINREKIAIKKDGIKVNKVNMEIYLKLVREPIFLFLCKKYKLEPFLNIMNRNITSRTVSKINKTCKLMLKKDNNFGLINAKNVSTHKEIQTSESTTTDLKFFNSFNIQN